MKTPRALAACLVLAALAGSPGAEEERRLSIEEAVTLALEKNLDLEIERVKPFIAREKTSVARAEFHPFLDYQLGYTRQNRYLNTVLEVSPESQAADGVINEVLVTPQAGVKGKLTTGMTYGLEGRLNTVKSNNPLRLFDISYSPSVTLALTQPLLRGFGFSVNKVRIRQAGELERQSELEVKAAMLDLIREVETKYWLLAYAQQHREIAEGNLEVAANLIERLTRMREAGMATDMDVSQAQLAAESRKADLARAGADLKIARARLRESVEPGQPVDVTFVALETPLDEGPPSGLQDKLDRALESRPEIEYQESIIESALLEERLARSNSMWKLDAMGSTTYSSLGGEDVSPRARELLRLQSLPDPPPPLPGDLEERDSVAESFRDGVHSWSVGINLEIPLGQRSSLAQLVPTMLRRSQEEIRLQKLRSRITIDLETAYHNMDAEWSRLNSAREAVRLAQLQLNAQERNLEVGLTTVWDVIEAQDRLASALDAEGRALALYATARSGLNAAQANSFERYRLVVEP